MQSKRAIWQSRLIDGATVALLVAAAVLFFDARRGGGQPQAQGALPALDRDSRVPVVEVTESGGTRAALLGDAAPAARHLVLFFRTDCPVCAQQRPAWEELAARARAAGWAVTGVTTEPLTEGPKEYLGAGVRVVQMEAAAWARLRTTVVPTTLAVGERGKVLLHHPGLLSVSATDSITRYF